MAGLSRAIPCPFRMPPAWPAGVGFQAKQKFVVTYTSPFARTLMLIQICSGSRCRSRLRCGVVLLQIYCRKVYILNSTRMYMYEPNYPFKMYVYSNDDLLMIYHRFADFGHDEADELASCVCIAFDDEYYDWLKDVTRTQARNDYNAEW